MLYFKSFFKKKMNRKKFALSLHFQNTHNLSVNYLLTTIYIILLVLQEEVRMVCQ
mgnify:CR=1 FL=1